MSPTTLPPAPPAVVASGEGYEVRVSRSSGLTRFVVFLDGESTLTVEVSHPQRLFHWTPAEVSWPSTSDRRPALARALAVALGLAADLADDLTAAVDLAAATNDSFVDREPGSVSEAEWQAERDRIADVLGRADR